jgi:beta-barrel assembly-enhancing protease
MRTFKLRSYRLPLLAFVILFARLTLGHNTPIVSATNSSARTEARSAVEGAQFDDPYADFRHARYSNNGLLTEREEIRLGAQLHREATKRFRLTDAGLARVDQIGQRVAKAGLRPNLIYKFHVIESKEINGFSIPGGHIYTTTALLKVANDEELASVLAHEVGHVVARHSLKTLKQSQEYDDIANSLGSITGVAGDLARDLGTAIGQLAAAGFLTLHTRDEELEADYLGVHTMSRAGINPQAMIAMFRKLQTLSGEEYDLLGSFFSDHPDMQERIDNTRYEIARMRRGR